MRREREQEDLARWQAVFREGFAPLLSNAALEALRHGLANDDSRLLQGATSWPPPLPYTLGWPVEAACALGYCGWKGDGLKTVAEVGEFFVQACFEADSRLGERAACRHFLNWFDDAPRAEVRRQLLAEVEQLLKERLAAGDQPQQPKASQ